MEHAITNFHSESLKIIRDIIRNSSLMRLKTHAACEDFDIIDADVKDAKIYAPWMSLILVSGKAVRVTFKAHYMNKDAQYLAARVYGSKVDEVKKEQADDFIKEFCNLTAGLIKKSLEDATLSVGISLPLVTRGFDEIFFPVEGRKNTYMDAWELNYAEASILCSALIEVFDDSVLDKVRPLELEDSDDDGEIDFL